MKDRINPENSTKWMGIGVAVSDSPTGPFTDAIGGPLWRESYANDFSMPENNRILSYYTSRSRKGPWQYRGVIMESEGANNHHSIVEYKGHWILFYHRWLETNTGCHKKQRHISAEYVHFSDDGTIKPITRTKEGLKDFPLKIQDME